MSASVTRKLNEGLLPFLNPSDPVVSVIQGAAATGLDDAESTLEQVHTTLGMIGATGTDVDDLAANYGLTRLSGESDAHLLSRISLLTQSGGASPVGITNQLNAINEAASFYEPAGGSVIGWDMRKNFRYDRETVTGTFARNSTATYGGTTYQANQPVLYTQGNMKWFGAFPSGGYTSATAGDTFTVPAASVIGTQSQGMIAVCFETGDWWPNVVSPATYVEQYLLDYDGTFFVWYDGSEWHWTIGGVELTATVAVPASGAHILVMSWGSGSASLFFDGTEVATAAVPNPPTNVSGNVYFGSDHTGSNQLSAFIGNITCFETWWSTERIQNLNPLLATPIYAQTLYSGAWFDTSLTGYAGGMILGVSNYVGVSVPTSGGGFTLDESTLDVDYMTDSQSAQSNLAQNVIFPLFKGGAKLFLYSPGSQT